MTRQIPRELIIDALDNAAFDEDCIYEGGSSGRGMYGDRCPGITLPGFNEAFRFFAELAHLSSERGEHGDTVSWMADSARWDSTAMEIIIYWPYLELTDDEDGQ